VSCLQAFRFAPFVEAWGFAARLANRAGGGVPADREAHPVEPLAVDRADLGAVAGRPSGSRDQRAAAVRRKARQSRT
jgi:hypothetical protein